MVLVFLGLAGFIVSIVALIKGKMPQLKINKRKICLQKAISDEF